MVQYLFLYFDGLSLFAIVADDVCLVGQDLVPIQGRVFRRTDVLGQMVVEAFTFFWFIEIEMKGSPCLLIPEVLRIIFHEALQIPMASFEIVVLTTQIQQALQGFIIPIGYGFQEVVGLRFFTLPPIVIGGKDSGL